MTEKAIVFVALGLWLTWAGLHGCAGRYAPPLPPQPDPTAPVFYMHADGGADGTR